MPILPNLITEADLTAFGYDTAAVAKAAAASARVRRYTGQQITAGTSTIELNGTGPWLLPQRPVTEVTSVQDADEEDVEWALAGPYLSSNVCPPLTVAWSHGFDPLPDELVELVCSIAARLASTPEGLSTGARTEQAGGEAVTWGADAYGGTTGLTSAERKGLDRIFPKRPRLTLMDAEMVPRW